MVILNHSRSFYLIITIIIVALFVSCDSEYETVFPDSVDERVRLDLLEHEALLKDAQHGWRAMLYTGAGPGFFYYFDFNDDGKVTMVSDFNATTAGEPTVTSWRLKSLQRTTLSFDTYSYIHLPADPDGNVSGGSNGEGLRSDFEFSFKRTAGDSVILQGLQHNSELILVKANEAEAVGILDDQILTTLQHTQQYTANNKGLRITLPDETVLPLAIDVTGKMVAAQYLSADGTAIETFRTPFTFSLNGIILKAPIETHGISAHEFIWDNEKKLFYVDDDASRFEFVSSLEPLILTPSVPLHSVIGRAYKTMMIPENPGENTLPGQSSRFIEVYNEAAESMQQSILQLTLHEFGFGFDPVRHEMNFDVIVSQVDGEGISRKALAQYIYTYEIDANGVMKLTELQANENAQVIQFDMRTMLQYLAEDSFTLQYIAGGFEVIGGFTSRENLDFSFSGYLNPKTNDGK